MAEMIDFHSALNLLGCDEAALQNMIDNGTVRAERDGGHLMLNADDVQAQAGGGSGSDSDSILVLDSESDDLSIDLGEVVDDGAQTMDMGQADATPELEPASGTDSLTFGDELEVVTFDEGRTEELELEGSPASADYSDDANTENLSFTDSNTAVITDVDETVVGSATATSDYQTVDFEDEDDGEGGPAAASGRLDGVRRSVRRERIRQPAVKLSPIWAVFAILCTLMNAAVLAPYFLIALWPNKDRVYHNNGDRAYGMDDTAWTAMASSFLGYTVEPDEAKFKESNGGETQWLKITTALPEEVDWFRIDEYLGDKYKEGQVGDRTDGFVVDEVKVKIDEAGKRTPVEAIKHDKNGQIKHVYQYEPAKGRQEGEDAALTPVLQYGAGSTSSVAP